MGWTPPSKFCVILTFLCMVLGIFIFMDIVMDIWDPFLPTFDLFGYNGWFVIALILFFLTWFFFYLGVKLKGF
ncbi:MAG: hypothetical protein CEE43_07685 [Promethearchaeota archaeon Loki_b32]|nr:MAG: hypothetical protein CEE43_07685 [Candidatus Lokiarchaeota archaeon Loki_b32]